MSEENKKKKNKTTNRRLMFITLLLTSILFTLEVKDELLFTDNIYDRDDNLKVNEDEMDEMISELSLELDKELTKEDIDTLLLYSIFSNNNINELDKKRLYDLMTLINDCNYIDNDKAYRDLSLLKIKYTKRRKGVSSNTLARYLFPENIIEIYDNNLNNDVLFHEIIHCIFNNEKTNKLPKYIIEGVTELLDNEYFSDKPYLETTSYVYELVLIKLLCELVGSDNVMLTYSRGDISYITNELEKNSSKDINYINDLFSKIDILFDDTIEIDKSLFDELYGLLKEVYKNKEYKGNFDNLNSRYLLDIFNGLSFEDRYFYYFDSLDKLGVSTKIYLNSNAKDKDYTFEVYRDGDSNNKTFSK